MAEWRDALFIDLGGILFLTQAILSGAITALLWRGVTLTRATQLLAGCVAALAGVWLANLLLLAFFAPVWLKAQTFFILLGITLLIQFAYHYPRALAAQRREARSALLLSALLAAALFGWRLLYAERATPLFRTALFAVVGAELLWVGGVWVRRVVAFTALAAPAPPERGRWAQFRRALTPPGGAESRSIRAFILLTLALLVLLTAVLLITYLLTPLGGVPQPVAALLFNLATTAFQFTLTVVYLNHTAEHSSFMSKLLLSTLAIALMLIGLLGQIVLMVDDADYQRDYLAAARALATVVQSGRAVTADNAPAAVALVLARPATPVAPVHPAYTVVFARDPALVDAAYLRAGRLWCERNICRTGDRMAQRYYMIPGMPLDYAGTQYVIGLAFAPYRDMLHRRSLPIAALAVGIAPVVWLLIPWFFRAALVAPLEHLLRGVRAVNAGQFETPLPVYYHDEIGRITETFNFMLATIQRERAQLEAQVAARTAELSQANAQLQAEMTQREQMQSTLVQQQRQLATLEERERIGRELHDDLGQVMGYFNVQTRAVEVLLQQGQLAQARAELRKLALMARDSHSDIRRYILGIRRDTPGLQASADFVARRGAGDFLSTLRQYLDMLCTYYGLEVDLHVPDDFPDLLLAPHVEVQLLRIIQEALTNVRKHAGVTQARLYLLADSDYARAIVSDEGAGFDPAAVPAEGLSADPHFGLTMMRERAASVNGTLDIRSRPGHGSQLTVKIPRVLPPVGAADANGAPTPGLPWRVLLVDDHPMFLEGLRTLLTARGLNVVGLARNGEEAQTQARALLPDVILMDVDMPACGGIEATRRIKAELPATRIVMLTVSAADATLFAALQAGASGYLLKNLADEDFYRFLKTIMRGETALSPEVAARILAEFKPPAAAPLAPEAEGLTALTPRQREVLDYAAQGLTYKEIGQRLHISENTTRYHMGKIIEILQVEGRREAVLLARRQAGS